MDLTATPYFACHYHNGIRDIGRPIKYRAVFSERKSRTSTIVDSVCLD